VKRRERWALRAIVYVGAGSSDLLKGSPAKNRGGRYDGKFKGHIQR
jgi:hypothetical protein